MLIVTEASATAMGRTTFRRRCDDKRNPRLQLSQLPILISFFSHACKTPYEELVARDKASLDNRDELPPPEVLKRRLRVSRPAFISLMRLRLWISEGLGQSHSG